MLGKASPHVLNATSSPSAGAHGHAAPLAQQLNQPRFSTAQGQQLELSSGSVPPPAQREVGKGDSTVPGAGDASHTDQGLTGTRAVTFTARRGDGGSVPQASGVLCSLQQSRGQGSPRREPSEALGMSLGPSQPAPATILSSRSAFPSSPAH